MGRNRAQRWRAATVATLAALVVMLGAMLPASATAGIERSAGSAGNAARPAVVNAAALSNLTPPEQAALAQRGFVVTAPDPLRRTAGLAAQSGPNRLNQSHVVYWQFYDLYDENIRTPIPNFITADAILHTFHVIYDQTFISLERFRLAPLLQRFVRALRVAAEAQNRAASGGRVNAAASADVAYIVVAERLLEPRASIPAAQIAPVRAELALIAAHRGVERSPMLGIDVDYAQFAPRGHYAGDAALSRYVQAMTWLGLPAFNPAGPDGDAHTLQALLLVRALTVTPAVAALWRQIDGPLTDWMGRGGDLTVSDYATVMAWVYPAGLPLSAFASGSALARFKALAGKLPGSRALGQGAAARPQGLRLVARGATPDGLILRALAGESGGTGRWPSGLDVAAALGSHEATALLAAPSQRSQRDNGRLAALQRHYSAISPADWHQTLYGSWLDTLRAVWGPGPPAAPAFMQTPSWAGKSLTTGLAAWSELRHDTILYPKQTLGLGGGGAGGGQIPHVAYVEPVPLIYRRLLDLTAQLKATLARAGALDTLPQKYPLYDSYFQPPVPSGEQGYRAALDGFAGLVALLERVSEQELQARRVSPGDLNALVQIGGELGGLTSFFQQNATPNDETPFQVQVAAIADVFTERHSAQALEVGTGDVLPVFATVTINGERWLTRGGVYSYYEFHQPVGSLLTDDAWRLLSRRPARPAWTAAYMAY